MYCKVLSFFVVIAVAVGHEDHHHKQLRLLHEDASHHGEGPHGHHHLPHHHGESPHGHHHLPHHHHNTHPRYEYEYRVKDHHTGDVKSQHETRDGDVVKGFYALHQPGGHERVVHYHSDHESGFHADGIYGIQHHFIPKHHH